jgi:hypothetical protein
MRAVPFPILLVALLAACNANQEYLFDYDEDGFEDAVDCGPTDPALYPGADDPFGDGVDQDCSGVDGVDADGDGFPLEDPGYDGDFSNWDCNDSDPTVYPGATEIESDGIDNDCDGIDAADLDNDGHIAEAAGGDDCNDGDANTYPGAPEQADGVDNDCDGAIDEGTINADDDGDGFSEIQGDCDDTNALLDPADADGDGRSLCSDPPDCDDDDASLTPVDLDGDTFSSCIGDCDDLDADVNPLMDEVCNLVDDDCDGVQAPDEVDGDGDGAAACNDCDDDDPALDFTDFDNDGVSPCAGDCDDLLPYVFPGAADLAGNGLDENCDGVDGIDSDGDGLASMSSGGLDCDDGDGYSPCTGDCDDDDGAVGPDAYDACDDGLDTDCGGDLILEQDNDGDGASECGGDCDDANPIANPDDVDGDGASSCDGDCDDGDVLLNLLDTDGDGWTSCTGDCDDLDVTVSPSLPEICNLKDDDCDGWQPADEVDGDGDGDAACVDCDDADPALSTLDADGDGHSSCGGDCDEDSTWAASIFPLALDNWGDGIDANCDGADGVDNDGDGWGSDSTGGPDCDDDDPAINPDAVESPGDGVDQDCDGLDAGDADGDGYGDLAMGGDDCNDADPSIYPGFYDDPTDGIDSNCEAGDGNRMWTFTASIGEYLGTHPTRQVLCDLDGDGIDDFVAGAPGKDVRGVGFKDGEVGIWYGPLSAGGPVGGADAVLHPPVPTVSYNVNAYLGNSLACLGDADGDGDEDLAVGSPEDTWSWEIYTGYYSKGITWIVSGALSGTVVLDGADWPRIGCNQSAGCSYQMGAWLIGPGDLNGDGLGDLVAGVGDGPGDVMSHYSYSSDPGSTELLYIINSPITVDLEMGTGDESGTLIVDSSTYDVFCQECPRSIDSAGDVNGDGFADLLVGTPTVSPSGAYDSGSASLLLGPLTGDLDLSGAAATFVSPYMSGWLGTAVAGIGDVNGDGYDDVALTVLQKYSPQHESSLHVFHGPLSGVLPIDGADATFFADQPSAGADTESLVANGIGDVDGDGFGDIALGTRAFEYASEPEMLDTAWVVYGPFNGAYNATTWDADLLWYDEYDMSVSTATLAPGMSGDVDGDGWPDAVFSIRTSDYGGQVMVFPNPYD